MTKTMLAIATALLFGSTMSGTATAQNGGYDARDDYQDERYERDYDRDQRSDIDQDGVDDRHDLFENRNRISWDRDRDGRNDRYDRPGGGYNPHADRYEDGRYDDGRYDDGRYDSDERDGRYGGDGRYDHDGRYDRDRGYGDRRYGERGRMAQRRYRAGAYQQPRNYRHASYQLGSRLPTGYWGSSYYIDYRPYGLSAPPRGYRWNRVGNDVYMVSVNNGLIREVMYSLFY